MTASRLGRFIVVALWTASLGTWHLPGKNPGSADSDERARAETRKVDEAFNHAVMDKDDGALEQILADKLSWVARGDRLTKAQVIADIKSGNLHFKSLTHEDLLINVFGNTTVVTGHSTSVLEYKGKLFTTPRLFTTVYMKLDGRWQMVAHQVSNVDEK
ncbi:MAG: nuclear transport factor 2 family protein [Candidatus Acidiferrum sp.]|jgi:hypothetical protein